MYINMSVNTENEEIVDIKEEQPIIKPKKHQS